MAREEAIFVLYVNIIIVHKLTVLSVCALHNMLLKVHFRHMITVLFAILSCRFYAFTILPEFFFFHIHVCLVASHTNDFYGIHKSH